MDSLHCHSLGMQRLRLGNSDPTDKTGIRKQGPDSQAFLQAAPPEALPLALPAEKGTSAGRAETPCGDGKETGSPKSLPIIPMTLWIVKPTQAEKVRLGFAHSHQQWRMPEEIPNRDAVGRRWQSHPALPRAQL